MSQDSDEWSESMPHPCPSCGEAMLVRQVYDTSTRTTESQRYCYPCENQRLWSLGRSVGK
jgi:predicted RNA-binding Zn-ribbon protein involved in translation (DUF1610 family)